MIVPEKYVSPVLVDKYIQAIQTELEGLTWLEFVYPMTRMGEDSEGNTYPQVFRNDWSVKNYNILPDSKAKSYSFFKTDGDLSFDDEDDDLNTIDIPISLIVWGRLDKIQPTTLYDYSNELLEDVLAKLKSIPTYSTNDIDRIEDISVNFNPQEIFEDYTAFDQIQYLMRKNFAFRIDFVIHANNACIPYSETTGKRISGIGILIARTLVTITFDSEFPDANVVLNYDGYTEDGNINGCTIHAITATGFTVTGTRNGTIHYTATYNG